MVGEVECGIGQNKEDGVIRRYVAGAKLVGQCEARGNFITQNTFHFEGGIEEMHMHGLGKGFNDDAEIGACVENQVHARIAIVEVNRHLVIPG